MILLDQSGAAAKESKLSSPSRNLAQFVEHFWLQQALSGSDPPWRVIPEPNPNLVFVVSHADGRVYPDPMPENETSGQNWTARERLDSAPRARWAKSSANGSKVKSRRQSALGSCTAEDRRGATGDLGQGKGRGEKSLI
jgi:hypothetical protein